MTTTSTAAAHIARDEYAGRWTRRFTRGQAPADTFTAAEIAAHSAEGVVWASFGHLRDGREGFGRTRYVADAEGNLHCYSSNGQEVITHPAHRALRVLVAR